MKTLRLNIIALLVALPCIAIAGNEPHGKYSKEKKISKTYSVNGDAVLDVNNQFGSIYVTTWDEDKTSIEIVIRVSGNDEDKVTKRLSSIDVDLEASKSLVRAHTRIGKGNGKNLQIEINYTIKIPKKGSIDLKNQYGAIITGKIFGRGRIDCQYGDVNIDELNDNSNSISLQYSPGKFNYIKGGDIDAQYSTLNITKAGRVRLRAEYTPTDIGEINDMGYDIEHGALNIKKGKNLSGRGEYSMLSFGQVSGVFNATSGYGDVIISKLDSSAKNVAINATYSSISIRHEDDYAFDFEFHLEYGGLRGTSSFKFTKKEDKDNDGHYEGYHFRSGVNRIYIKCEYGDISMGKA